MVDGNAMTDSALYETDIVAWADRQVAELRRLEEAGITNAVDWANVIEEIESVGRSERRTVESLVRNAFVHLLKIIGDPGSLSTRAWTQEVATFLRQASERATSSIKESLALEELWRDALKQARSELKLYDRTLPDDVPAGCPFDKGDILAGDADPGILIARLRIPDSRP